MTPSTLLRGLRFAIPFLALASASAEDLPDMRPALVGNGPNALINLIDTQGLIKRGQGNAILLISCFVLPDSQTYAPQVYRVSAGGEKLKDEVKAKFHAARFIPAVYNHHKIYATFYGTVVFAVISGKPRLRIFANQEPSELEKESDFIEPQPIHIPNHFYDFPPYPGGSWASEDRPAVVDLSLSVDASGKMTEVHVLKEEPIGKGFGNVALKKMKVLTYLPAFRNGKPVASSTHVGFPFMPAGWSWK